MNIDEDTERLICRIALFISVLGAIITLIVM